MWWWLYALAVMSGAVVGEDAAQELETQRGPRRGRPRREGMGDRPRSRRREMPLSDDEMGLREMRRRNKMRRREDADEGEDGAWTPQAGPRPKKKKWRREDGESREDGAIRERAGASRPPRGGKGGGRRKGKGGGGAASEADLSSASPLYMQPGSADAHGVACIWPMVLEKAWACLLSAELVRTPKGGGHGPSAEEADAAALDDGLLWCTRHVTHGGHEEDMSRAACFRVKGASYGAQPRP